MTMPHAFDLTTSRQRIARINSTISAQKRYIVATCFERRAEAELNLKTLESMRIGLGLSQDVLLHDRDGSDQGRMLATESLLDIVGAGHEGCHG